MVNDLHGCHNLKKMYEIPVVLYGAGNMAKRTIQILNDFDITPHAIVDKNENRKRDFFNGTVVWAPDELYDFAKNNDIVLVISTVKYTDEIISELEMHDFNCNNVYSLWGLFYMFYFNFPNILTSEALKFKYYNYYQAWIMSQKSFVYEEQTKNPLKLVMNTLLLDVENDVPVIVYQPGKVGSNTVEHTLRQYKTENLMRSHGVLYPCRIENNGLEQTFIKRISEFKKVKFITLISDPVAKEKDVGHFFHKISAPDLDVGWMVKGIIEKDFDYSFLNYLSVITPFSYVESFDKEKYPIISHIDYIGKISEYGAYWGWYEEELKNNLGIDILEYEFDKEKGYSIIEKDNIELLVIRLDKLNVIEETLGDFCGIEKLKLISVNQGFKKAYRYAYRQFKREMKLPRTYLDFNYKNNKYTSHFYTEEEIEKKYKDYEKNMIDKL